MADEDGKAVAISTFLKGGILLSAPSSCTFFSGDYEAFGKMSNLKGVLESAFQGRRTKEAYPCEHEVVQKIVRQQPVRVGFLVQQMFQSSRLVI